MRRRPNGDIAVFQDPVNGWEISYNPDTDTFCVERWFDLCIVKEYAGNQRGLDNARYWARHHPAPHGCGDVPHERA